MITTTDDATLHTSVFLFNAPPPSEIYTLSLHDALPICQRRRLRGARPGCRYFGDPAVPRYFATLAVPRPSGPPGRSGDRSEEHTSELQSRPHLVCRLLLEKKNTSP